MATYCIQVLPSGRVVKFGKLNVKGFFGASQRAAAKMTNPGGSAVKEMVVKAKGSELSMAEVIATCLKGITKPIPFIYPQLFDADGALMVDEDGKPVLGAQPDADAMLDAALAASAKTATPAQLAAGGGGFRSVDHMGLSGSSDFSMDVLFGEDLQDFITLHQYIQDATFPLDKAKAATLMKTSRMVSEG